MTIRGIEPVVLAFPVARLDEARSCYTGLMVDEPRALVKMLKDQGYRAEPAMPLGGRECVFTRDPFGNKFKRVAYPS